MLPVMKHKQMRGLISWKCWKCACVCRWFQSLVTQRTAAVHAEKYWMLFTVNQRYRTVEGWYM